MLQLEEIVPDFVAQIDRFPFHAMDGQVISQLRAAWTRYPVLRLRNGEIGDAEQVAFTRALGPIFLPRLVHEGKHDDFAEILVVSNKKRADGSAAGDLGDYEVKWHTDTWWVDRPPSAAILRAIQIPASGGDTHFCNMYAAFASLPEKTKSRLHGLCIHHQTALDTYGAVRRGMEQPSSSDVATWPGVDHPVVRRHVDSGKPCLYLGAAPEWQSIVGMAQSEARALLDELWRHATDSAHRWSQTWAQGDMLVWDNRCLMHHRDAFDSGSLRVMHRTTVEGERPVAAA